MKNSKELIENALLLADIKIGGNRPWDIQIHNPKFYDRVINEDSIGLGESYMDGWWDCKKLDELFYKISVNNLTKKVKSSPLTVLNILSHRLFNHQTRKKAKQAIHKHYDIGNFLFEKMLDKEMNYSCAFWENATNLDQAQHNKMDLICKKLHLSPGMTLLDIGCGWGALAKHAATYYKVNVVGITISENQKKLATENCKGLPVSIELKDYRDIEGQYDRVVSVGMFEHVGYKNYVPYIKTVHKCLKDDGIFLLHSIGNNASYQSGDPWMNKYIFPHGMLPSIKQIGEAVEPYFVMEDWHNFGAYYDPTLMAWYDNFNKHWPELKKDYDDRFYRMWNYYLLSCAGLFRARQIQLWQVVLSKKGIENGYRIIRN